MDAARPALWKIADADTTIYLFGTIHLLPEHYDWETPGISAAVDASQELILEAVLDRQSSGEIAGVMQAMAMDMPMPPVASRIMPDRRVALERAIARTGMPRAAFDRMESWAVALTLASAQLRDLPASSDYGIEPLLTRRFREAGKAVKGFETPAEQFGYFDRLRPVTQARFLQSVIDDKSSPRDEYQAMLAAWRAGDLGRIALSFDDETKISSELKDALLTRRNARWTGVIAHRMAKPGTIFIAVGAGHLTGKDSVIAMLGARGYTAIRLQ